MQRRILVKLSYFAIQRLKEINQSMEDHHTRTGYPQIKACLLDFPTRTQSKNIHCLNPEEKNYGNILTKKITSTKAVMTSRAIIWEHHPNDPKIPLLLHQVAYTGKIFLFNS